MLLVVLFQLQCYDNHVRTAQVEVIVGYVVLHSSDLERAVSAMKDAQFFVYLLCYSFFSSAVFFMIMSLEMEMKRDSLSIAINVLLPGIFVVVKEHVYGVRENQFH